MAKTSNNVWARVGVEPEARLRWLLDFGDLNPVSLTAAQRAEVLQEARAFVVLQDVDPPLRRQMRSYPPPTDATPKVLTGEEAWSAQRWLKQGLDLLRQSQKWNFKPRVEYELDAHGGLFWTRMTANGPSCRSGARPIAPRAALKRSELASGAKRIPRRTAR
jgi:hypothetical protein